MKIKEVEKIVHKKIYEYAKTMEADVAYESGKKTANFCVSLKRCDIIFKLTKKESILLPAGTLYCQISVGKMGTERYFLHEVINVLNPRDFQATMFTYLYKEERIEKAFSSLADIIDGYISDIENILADENTRKTLYDNRITDIKKAYRLNDERFAKVCEYDNLDVYQEMIERVILQRLTKFVAYQCYLKGDLNKAIKKYRKLIEKDRALIYEKALCEYMEGADIIAPLPNGFEDVKNPEEEPAEMFKLMALPFVFWSVVMLLIFAVMNAFLNQNTVYTDTMEWYWTFIFALVPAMFTGIALRRVQYKSFKNDDAYELDLLRESKGENKFVNIVTFIVVILALVFFVNLATMGTRCYEDYLITDESEKLFSRDWQRYYYKDIDKVYYIKGRYNEYGGYIKRASYVLTFKDGRQLDTDLWDSLEEIRNTVFPIMHIENKEIMKVHSERDIK